MANELQAYTLTDRGTWLAYQGGLDLQVLTQGDPALFKPYSVISVNPERHPRVNFQGAQAFSDWLTAPATCKLVQSYQVEGEQLFTPDCTSTLSLRE
jgi:tungstate transport system substrate-binding protein